MSHSRGGRIFAQNHATTEASPAAGCRILSVMTVCELTSCVVLVSLCIVCSAPVLAQDISASGAIGPRLALNDTAPRPMDNLPICECPEPATEQIFQKSFADVWSDSCDQSDHAKPYRHGLAYHMKTICDNGSYWTCSYTLFARCDSFLARPSCPQDTCRQP